MIIVLEEIAESVGYGVTASACDEPVGPKFLRITDIQNGRVDWNNVPWCKCKAQSSEAARLRRGDIVFARTGATTGKSCLINDCPDNAVFASYLIRVRLRKTADPGYVSQFFQTADYWNQITTSVRGVAQPGVNATTLKKLQIPLPPLPEQKRIAKILDAADALRAKRRESLAQLDILLQSTFIDMFGDPVTNPMGWKSSRKLGEVAEIVSGITKGRKVKGELTLREVPYLAVANVQDRHLKLDPIKTIAATEPEIEKYALRAGDLLLTEGGDPDKLGRGSLWNNELDNCIHQNHVFRVRLKANDIDPVFLNWLVGSARGKQYFLRSAKQTTGIASINMTQLKAFPMLSPPLNLQRRFATIVESVENQKARLRAHLAELGTLFVSLQSRAFNGEL